MSLTIEKPFFVYWIKGQIGEYKVLSSNMYDENEVDGNRLICSGWSNNDWKSINKLKALKIYLVLPSVGGDVPFLLKFDY